MFIDDIVNKILEHRFRRLLGSAYDYEKYFSAREETMNDPRVAYISKNVERIHSNTSTLLTHISAMIAALGILILTFKDGDESIVYIYWEIVLYTIFAIICIYNLRYRKFNEITTKFDEEKLMESYYFNYLRRRYIYVISTNGVLITTIIFLGTVVWRVIELT